MLLATEEKLNIKAVIDHIEKETCIQFRDDTDGDLDENQVQAQNDASKPENASIDDNNNNKLSMKRISSESDSNNEKYIKTTTLGNPYKSDNIDNSNKLSDDSKKLGQNYSSADDSDSDKPQKLILKGNIRSEFFLLNMLL